MFAASALNDLMDELGRAGFETGPGVRQKVHMLMAELAGGWPGERTGAADLLADYLRP